MISSSDELLGDKAMTDERVALVTGAGKGIGREIARKLHADGFHVIINYRDSADAAKQLALELHDGLLAIAIAADVTNRHQVDRMKERLLAEFSRIDVLVN